jgi:hypothetical protein
MAREQRDGVSRPVFHGAGVVCDGVDIGGDQHPLHHLLNISNLRTKAIEQ